MRVEDIPTLARRFLAYYRFKIARNVNYISDTAMTALCQYEWPGNVRELMNVIERAMLICKGDSITADDLPSIFNKSTDQEKYFLAGCGSGLASWKDKTLPQVKNEVLDQIEKLYISMILKETEGRVGQAAKRSGIHSRGLYNKMKRFGMRKENFRK
jgi:DNA-binding NtrC family response regulator